VSNIKDQISNEVQMTKAQRVNLFEICLPAAGRDFEIWNSSAFWRNSPAGLLKILTNF
jgi:hypothetical protein